MDGLFEFVFESVPPKKVGPMIEKIIGSISNVININYIGTADYLDKNLAINHNFWENISISPNNMAYFLNIDRLKINNLSIKNGSIYLVHYDMTTDITLLISSSDCKAEKIITSQELYLWAKELANTWGITNFYGGLEPASDKETQLYSNKGIGPLIKI